MVGVVAEFGENIVHVFKLAVVVIAELVDIFLDSGFDEFAVEGRGVDFGEVSINLIQTDDDFVIGDANVNHLLRLVIWDNPKSFELRNLDSGSGEG